MTAISLRHLVIAAGASLALVACADNTSNSRTGMSGSSATTTTTTTGSSNTIPPGTATTNQGRMEVDKSMPLGTGSRLNQTNQGQYVGPRSTPDAGTGGSGAM